MAIGVPAPEPSVDATDHSVLVASRLALVACSAVLAGCNMLGPQTIRGARFDYNQEIARSWNEQLLLNLVRLRYRDTPQFLEVGSVLAQYGLAAGASAAPTVNIDGTTRTQWGFGANVAYEERPTITYVPLQGEDFTRRLLTPMSAATIVLLSQTGWSVERLLLSCVQQINDVRNAASASGPTPLIAAHPTEFRELARRLRELQVAEALQIEVVRTADSERSVLRILDSDDPAIQQSAARVRELLGVGPDQTDYRITSNVLSRQPNDIAIAGRSLLGVLFYLSHGVEVPVEDEEAGLVTVTRNRDGERFDWSDTIGSVLRIRSGSVPGAPPFVAVPYRGHRFWIPDDDLQTKSTFFLLHYLFALQAASEPTRVPVVTVPTGS